jgi:D-alanyl-D-alanine dipeptidase
LSLITSCTVNTPCSFHNVSRSLLTWEYNESKPTNELKGEHDLIDLGTLNNTFKLDIRYATESNFTGKILYSEPKAYLQRDAALALNQAQEMLSDLGLGLVIYDAYRPLAVQKEMWSIKPDRRYVADPKLGSNHNRGMAVDVGLYDLETGSYLEMPTEFDAFNRKAWANATVGVSEMGRYNRSILKQIMKQCGFKMNTTEWWHFDYKDCRKYPVLDIPFHAIVSE